MKRAFIFTGGTIKSYSDLPINPHEEDLIICADSGIHHCINMQLSPHIWVGDFDSANLEYFSKLQLLRDTDIVRLSPDKDDTDTEHALHIAMDMGFKNIIVVGGFGGRLDHTFANAFLAEKAYKKGVTLIVTDEKNILHYLENSTLRIIKNNFKYVSIIPLETSVVSCSGFRYPLNKEVIHRGPARCVSNELVDDEGFITVFSGCVFIVESID